MAKQNIASVKRRVRHKKIVRETVEDAYRDETERKRILIQKANATHKQLVLITHAVRKLLGNEEFVRLLKNEGLDTIPQRLAARIERGDAFPKTKKSKHRFELTPLRRKRLPVQIANIQPLKGVCSEVIKLLKDQQVSIHAFAELKKLAPIQQIDVAQLMIAMNRYSVPFTRSLSNASPVDQLVDAPKQVKGLTAKQVALMKQESATLDREFRLIEPCYGDDHLDLVVLVGYVRRLIAKARITRYLAQRFSEILAEFEQIAGSDRATNPDYRRRLS